MPSLVVSISKASAAGTQRRMGARPGRARSRSSISRVDLRRRRPARRRPARSAQRRRARSPALATRKIFTVACGKHDRADVAPLHHHARRRSPMRALQGHQALAHHRHGRHLRGQLPRRGGADGARQVAAVGEHVHAVRAAPRSADRAHRTAPPAPRRRRSRCRGLVGEHADDAIHGAGVDVAQPERLGQAPADRALAGARPGRRWR